MSLYASGTSVPVTRSRIELETLLRKYGATEFRTGYSESNRAALVEFAYERKLVRFVLTMPALSERRFTHRPDGKPRTPDQALAACSQVERQRWRALLLCVRAKLEIVRNGIVPFEHEFLPYVVLANRRTVAEEMLPRIELAIAANAMPQLALPAPT